jgi:hypothetical protein
MKWKGNSFQINGSGDAFWHFQLIGLLVLTLSFILFGPECVNDLRQQVSEFTL